MVRVLLVTLLLLISQACRAKPMPSIGPDDAEVVLMTETVYGLCGGDLGPIAKSNVVRDVVEVAQGFFDTHEDRLAFILLVCIESRFNPGAASKAGAVGLTQVIPRYAAEFSKRCYLSTKGIDLYVPRVNLMTGACQFRYLIEQFDGNYSLALAGYNAGERSDTVKKLRKLQKLNSETSDYLARFAYLRSLYHQQEQSRGTGPSVGGPK